MSIEKKFIDQFVNVTSKAAVASYKFIGKKDKIAADKAAVDSMRNELNRLNINGKIVIGEGELDEAPMLYIGEKVGSGSGSGSDLIFGSRFKSFLISFFESNKSFSKRFSPLSCFFLVKNSLIFLKIAMTKIIDYN